MASRCITENDMSMCTGCMACMDVCPTKAITEGFTNDGFRIPEILEDKCVKCGKCVCVCNIKTDRVKNCPSFVYRMAAKDDSVRMKCSSGGIFALLAEKTLESDGVVIGAAFNSEHKDVCHMTSDECSLEELYRSKYVQSNTIGIYKKTEQILKDGRNVLFCGTPCQVRALHSFLKGKKHTGTILTVDFMCHGVPSTQEFRDFIHEREQEEKALVANVTFREKDKGWRKQIIKTYYSNGRVWKKSSYYYYYYYMFLKNYSLRDSCYFCKEYNTHTADITLADDWSGSDNDNIGTSRVFINTSYGQNAIEQIMDKVNCSDITESAMSTLEIYSHSGYDYEKKELWKKTLEIGGYRKAKRQFFLKVSIIPIIKEKLWEKVSLIRTVCRNMGDRK